MADGVEIEQLILGRVHPQVDTDKMFERILLGITDSCQNCEIIEKKIYKNLPNQFDGVFENKQVMSGIYSPILNLN
jgi:predicted thioredoxin/glutaredoxin